VARADARARTGGPRAGSADRPRADQVAAAVVLPVIAGLLSAVAFMLLPLGTVKSRGQTAWCGPGKQSGNAIQVLLHPDVVYQNTDRTQPSPTADTDAFKSVCKSEAISRFVDAVMSIGSGIVLAVVLLFILHAGLRPPP
jgi:hypothetical protein